MATFKLFVPESETNGGTVWIKNIQMALNSLGHIAETCNFNEYQQADYLICQSEWAHIETVKESAGKKIVLLGHFKGGVYHEPSQLTADYWVSTWKGDVVDKFPFPVIYMPHAYPVEREKLVSNSTFPCPFVGNTYPLRREDWLFNIPVQKLNGINPDELSDLYRKATVCPNIHGDFQKGVVSTEPSTLADIPGYALNERVFWISGAGGFQVVDNNPLIRDFFTTNEMVMAKSPFDFQRKIKYFLKYPEKREPFIKNAREKILAEHTYQHRVTNLLNQIQ